MAAERGATVSGLDAAEPLLKIARQRVPDGDFRQGDMEALPFVDDSFDTVFAANCIQFPANRATAVAELVRVCAENGRIVAGLFGPPDKVMLNVVGKAIVEALPEPPSGPNPFELSMPGKLETLFETAGLKVVQSGSVLAPFSFADMDSAYRGFLSAGPIQVANKLLGKKRLREVIYGAIRPFQQEDGTILIEPNVFIYVVATR